MHTSVCEVCLNSNILCSGCGLKLSNNEITEADINVSRFLYKLSEEIKNLKDVEIKRIVDSDVLLIVAKIGDGAKLVGKNGSVVKALAKEYKKSIRVVEEAPGNIRKFVENLVSPLTVVGINRLYTPEGEVYRVRIPFSQKNSLVMDPKSFSQIISNVYNRRAELIFD